MLFNDIPGCKDIKPIGFGPNILNYSSRLPKTKTGIGFLVSRANQIIKGPLYRRDYTNAISSAIKCGFHLIDFSSSYGNQDLVGDAIRKSGVSRSSLFITTRISNKAQTGKYVKEEFINSLKALGLEYVDLLQFHWPVTGCFLNTWKEMESLKEQGLVRHLGTANCHQHHIEDILGICKFKPEICQFEIHPLFTQKDLINFYQSHGIIVEAYTPVARCDDRLIRLPLLKRIGEKYKKSVIQVVLRWHIQNGVVPIVRAMSSAHQIENISVFDFELTEDEMESIDAININSRLRYDPDNCDFSIL